MEGLVLQLQACAALLLSRPPARTHGECCCTDCLTVLAVLICETTLLSSPTTKRYISWLRSASLPIGCALSAGPPTCHADDAARALLYAAAALGHAGAARLLLLLLPPEAGTSMLHRLVAACGQVCTPPQLLAEEPGQAGTLAQQQQQQQQQQAADPAACFVVAILQGEAAAAGTAERSTCSLTCNGSETMEQRLTVRRGALEALRTLLDAAPSLALQADSGGRLPLHHAAHSQGCSEAVRLLLQAAPEAAEAADGSGLTPLHAATAGGCAEAAALLLDAAPHTVWSADCEKRLPLHVAAAASQQRVGQLPARGSAKKCSGCGRQRQAAAAPGGEAQRRGAHAAAPHAAWSGSNQRLCWQHGTPHRRGSWLCTIRSTASGGSTPGSTHVQPQGCHPASACSSGPAQPRCARAGGRPWSG